MWKPTMRPLFAWCNGKTQKRALSLFIGSILAEPILDLRLNFILLVTASSGLSYD